MRGGTVARRRYLRCGISRRQSFANRFGFDTVSNARDFAAVVRGIPATRPRRQANACAHVREGFVGCRLTVTGHRLTLSFNRIRYTLPGSGTLSGSWGRYGPGASLQTTARQGVFGGWFRWLLLVDVIVVGFVVSVLDRRAYRVEVIGQRIRDHTVRNVSRMPSKREAFVDKRFV